jgi:hypothetical protein
VPTAAAWKAAQINANAETKTGPNPKAETSTRTETSADTDAKNHNGAKRGNVRSADTDQMMGDGPTTKPNDAGQPSPGPDKTLEHGRQTPNPKENREYATPQ